MKKRLSLLLCSAFLASTVLIPYPAQAASPYDEIGLWDGVTPSAALETTYEDPSQQDVPFGQVSFYRRPWRAYMETQPASRFLDSLGSILNTVNKDEADATVQVLAESGIQHVRLEMGWGNFTYDDEFKLPAYKEAEYKAYFKALKKYKIRPLILLNSNAGLPVPYKKVNVTLTQNAAAGDRSIFIKPADASKIVVNYTGLDDQAYRAMFPAITAANHATGELTLSAPLTKNLSAGAKDLIVLKYQPLSGRKFADGSINPAHDETLNGWKTYVNAVTDFAKKELGTENASDAGFDLEVWNELMFGSDFLYTDYYHDPAIAYSEPTTYTMRNGTKVTGFESLLAITADYVTDPAHPLDGVKIINGFANQRPWDNGKSMLEGVAGFSRHYYVGYNPVESFVNQASFFKTRSPEQVINALGRSGSAFAPNFVDSHPEYWYYGHKTENIVRDLQPFPGPWNEHYRQAAPQDRATEAEVWQTENNYDMLSYLNDLSLKNGIPTTDPRYKELRHHIAAKVILRNYVFQSHKGLKRNYMFTAKDHDLALATIPSDFFSALASNGYVLNDAVRATIGPQMTTLKNAVNVMKTGQAVDNPRKLEVGEVVEYKPRLVFKGDGTAAHPNSYNRDDLAILPFQLSDNKFAIGYYVVTRNMTQRWDKNKDPLDPAAYDMPPQTFEVELKNINGSDVHVYAFDPVLNNNVPVPIVSQSEGSIKVELETTDYPRFLIVEEAVDGPAIHDFELVKAPVGGAISFTPNFTGNVDLTWGPYPIRAASQFKHEQWSTYNHWREIAPDVTNNHLDTVNFLENGGSLFNPATHGAARITGKIKPKYTETYTFNVQSDNNVISLSINGQQIISPETNLYSGQIQLNADTEYDLQFEYWTHYPGKHQASLFWHSASQRRELVTSSDSNTNNRAVIAVTKGQKAYYQIPNLKMYEGIQLRFSQGAVANRFPQWNYDLTAKLYPSTPAVTTTEVSNLAAERLPNGIKVSWTNPVNPDISSVNLYKNGTLIYSGGAVEYVDTAVAEGETPTYTVKTVDGFQTESPGLHIQVKNPNDTPPSGGVLSHLVAEPSSILLGVGKSANVVIKAVYSEGEAKNVTPDAVWSGFNSMVVHLDKGKIVGASKGQTVISATYGGLDTKISVTVNDSSNTPPPPPPPSVPRFPGGGVPVKALTGLNIPTSLAYSEVPVQLSLQGSYSDGTTAVISGAEWTTSDSSIATVSNAGLVAFTKKAGEVIITARYSSLTASKSVTVNSDGMLSKPEEIDPRYNLNVVNMKEVQKNVLGMTEQSNASTSFTDIQSHWAKGPIMLFEHLHVINGKTDTAFEPDQNMTRAEFVTMLANLIQDDGKKSASQFNDAAGHWAYRNIALLTNIGLVDGYEDGTFRPDNVITRTEMSSIFSKMLHLEQIPPLSKEQYEDTKGHWGENMISKLSNLGILEGKEYHRFAPEDFATRAEAVVMMARVLEIDSKMNLAMAKFYNENGRSI